MIRKCLKTCTTSSFSFLIILQYKNTLKSITRKNFFHFFSINMHGNIFSFSIFLSSSSCCLLSISVNSFLYKFSFRLSTSPFYFTIFNKREKTALGSACGGCFSRSPFSASLFNMFSITTLFSTLTIYFKEFLPLHPDCCFCCCCAWLLVFASRALLIIAMTCARCRNFSNFQAACSRGSCAAGTGGSRGSWAGCRHCASNTRTSDRRSHVDSLQGLAAESVTMQKERKKHFSEIMLRRASNSFLI
jgi:hypothetical protein